MGNVRHTSITNVVDSIMSTGQSKSEKIQILSNFLLTLQIVMDSAECYRRLQFVLQTEMQSFDKFVGEIETL
jgi:hypothetical protein